MVSSQFDRAGSGTPRILLFFPGALGDFLCFAPALFALGRRRAPARFTVVARPSWTALLDPARFDSASIDETAVAQLFGSGDLDQARRRFSPAAHIYSWTGYADAGFAARLAELADGRASVFPFRAFAEGEHASQYYARCLNVETDPVEIHRDPQAESWADEILRSLRRPVLAVHAGSGSPDKNWPGFQAAVAFWRHAGASVLELQGPAEAGRAPLPATNGVLREELPRIAALLRRCTFLGNDSGITHLAAACGAAGLALFPHGNAVHWRPLSTRIRLLEGRRDCAHCQSRLCLHRLAVTDVTSALEGLL